MKTRPLPSQEYFLKRLRYEPYTGHLYWLPCDEMSNQWNSRYAGQRAFTAQTAKGYHTGAIDSVLYRANRIIYKMVHGTDPEQVDHDNGVNNDDRISNLIDVTHTGNQRNMKRSRANKSGQAELDQGYNPNHGR